MYVHVLFDIGTYGRGLIVLLRSGANSSDGNGPILSRIGIRSSTTHAQTPLGVFDRISVGSDYALVLFGFGLVVGLHSSHAALAGPSRHSDSVAVGAADRFVVGGIGAGGRVRGEGRKRTFHKHGLR